MATESGTRDHFQAKRFLVDDDNTVAPPPLSAYSIALLSKSHPLQHGSTPSPFAPKKNHILKDSLERKLSEHFGPSRSASRASKSPGVAASTTPSRTTSASVHAVSNTSYSNLSLASNASNVSASFSAGVGSITNASNVTNTSHNAADTSAQKCVTESPDPSSPRRQKSSPLRPTHSKSLAVGGHSHVSFAPRPVTSASSIKRSRISRRFKSLGSPKRASEFYAEREALKDSLSAQQETDAAEPVARPSENSPPISNFDKLSFVKSLESVNSEKPSWGLPVAADLNLDWQAPQFSSIKNHLPRESKLSPKPQEAFRARWPLQELPQSSLNSRHGSLPFKKPKLPKEKLPSPQPSLVAAPQKQYQPYLPQHQGSEADQRKILLINGVLYEKLELLGRGGTSKVYKVRSPIDKRALAVKKVSFDQFDEACVKGFKGEIDLLLKLNNVPRVVSLIDHAVSNGSIYLVMECGDIDLAHVFLNKISAGVPLDLNFVRFHAAEVFRCVQAVHDNGIVHSDLKPANFLFVKGILKIIDFGIANAVPDHTANIYRSSQIGTPNYMAPEALIEVNQTLGLLSMQSSTTWRVGKPSDIWSCGCMLYQMFYGRPPYAAFSGQQRIMAIVNPEVKIKFPATGLDGVTVPQSAITLMQKCLERNPDHRWTVEECLNCDFLRPRAVSKGFMKDLLVSAVNFGHEQGSTQDLTDETFEKLAESVIRQIEEMNFA